MKIYITTKLIPKLLFAVCLLSVSCHGAYPFCEAVSHCLCKYSWQKLRVSLQECGYQLDIGNLTWFDDFHPYVSNVADYFHCVMWDPLPPKDDWCPS